MRHVIWMTMPMGADDPIIRNQSVNCTAGMDTTGGA